jgi:hypothetical protein
MLSTSAADKEMGWSSSVVRITSRVVERGDL